MNKLKFKMEESEELCDFFQGCWNEVRKQTKAFEGPLVGVCAGTLVFEVVFSKLCKKVISYHMFIYFYFCNLFRNRLYIPYSWHTLGL